MRTISRQDRSSVVDDNTAWSCGGVQLRSKMSLSQPVGKYLNSNMIGIRGANCSREPFIVIFWLRTHLQQTLRFLVGANVDHYIKIEYVPLPAPHNVFSCLIFQKKSGLGDVDPSFSDTLGKGRWNPLFIDLPCSKIGGNCREIQQYLIYSPSFKKANKEGLRKIKWRWWIGRWCVSDEMCCCWWNMNWRKCVVANVWRKVRNVIYDKGEDSNFFYVPSNFNGRKILSDGT